MFSVVTARIVPYQCMAWAVVTRSAHLSGRPVSSALAGCRSMFDSLVEAL